MIQRFKPDITFKGGKFVTIMREGADGEYVHMPDDGRPCHTDILIDRALRVAVPAGELVEMLYHWNEGAWDEAMEIVENYEEVVRKENRSGKD